MSGGAFDYLCYKELEHFVSWQIDSEIVESMARELDLLCPEIAKELRDLKEEAESFRDTWEVRWKKLVPVLKAVEWWCSNDWGKSQVDEAIAKYRTNAP